MIRIQVNEINLSDILKSRKKFFSFFLQFASFLVYIVSVSFAILVFIKFISKKRPDFIWFILCVSILICNFINYFLSKKLPERFYSWNTIFSDIANIRIFFYLPPFSTGVTSAALTIFILSLFYESINLVWLDSLLFLNDVYELAGIYFIVLPLFLIMVALYFHICTKTVTRFIKKVRGKPISLFAVISSIIVIFLGFYYPIKLVHPLIDEKNYFLTINLVKYLVSFSPVYWFYLLFVNSKRIRW